MDEVQRLYDIIEISDTCKFKFKKSLPHLIADGFEYNICILKIDGDEAYIELRGCKKFGKKYMTFNYKNNSFIDIKESLILHGFRYYNHLIELIENNLYKKVTSVL